MRDLVTLDEVIDAIRTLAVRGAPAIGVAAAIGLVVALERESEGCGERARELLARYAERLIASRPTAVNLSWAVRRLLVVAATVDDDTLLTAIRADAEVIRAEDVAMCEAIGRFGSDKPDTRYGYEITDLTEVLRGTEFKAFGGVIETGGAVRGINFGKRELSRAQLDGLIDDAKELGAKGLVWAFREGDGWRVIDINLGDGDDGSDFLVNMETLRFGNGSTLSLAIEETAPALTADKDGFGGPQVLPGLAEDDFVFSKFDDTPLVLPASDGLGDALFGALAAPQDNLLVRDGHMDLLLPNDGPSLDTGRHDDWMI